MTPTSEFIDTAQLAEWLGLARVTLDHDRLRGEGPPFIRVGKRAIRYCVADVRTWLAARTVGK